MVAHSVMVELAREDGQAMIFLLVAAGVIMAFACGLYITSSYLVAKIQAQNAADAAAVAGAGALADTLDLLVFSNWVRGASYLAAGFGAPLRAAVVTVAPLAEKSGPALAAARTVEVGLANGAIAVPLNKPNLDVRQGIFTGMYRERMWNRTNGRYMRASTTVMPDIPDWIAAPFQEHLFLGIVPPVGAVAEASVSGWGLGRAHFKGVLGRTLQIGGGFFRRLFGL